MNSAWLKFKQKIKQWQGVLISASSVTALIIAGSWSGLFQLPEWIVLDLLFRYRLPEPEETRIVLVTISETDIKQIGQWPIPDAILAQAIKNIQAQQPRAIGIDLYRDLPVEPGHQELEQVLESTPNLIGVEKAVGERVPPAPTLAQLDQVGLSDLILDADGKVRRGLLSIKDRDGQIKLGLAVRLALMYLEDEGITLTRMEPRFPWQQEQLKLGQALIIPFQKNDGGYIRADDGGYQILINYRGTQEKFPSISLSDVLEDRIPSDLIRDNLVLMGSTAQSLNDFFYTPYSTRQHLSPQQTPGIAVHANLSSQLLSAALDGRPLIRVWSNSVEWLWIGTWCLVGATSSWIFLETTARKGVVSVTGWLLMGLLLTSGILLIISYLAFAGGWWLPTATPIFALATAAVASAGYRNSQIEKLATTDGLTGVANRRYFDEYLDRAWAAHRKKQQPLSLILCDVDYFKRYNDTYGHQAGDECLQQVAQALCLATRSTDLVARYGGEEFAVILPKSDPQTALEIAGRICARIRALQMPHKYSEVSDYLTLSCGVSSNIPDFNSSPALLINAADKALYQAKEEGRNRACTCSGL